MHKGVIGGKKYENYGSVFELLSLTGRLVLYEYTLLLLPVTHYTYIYFVLVKQFVENLLSCSLNFDVMKVHVGANGYVPSCF
jgi:hypothetical protein